MQEEMKQNIICEIQKYINEYVYVENIYRLYCYYDRQCNDYNELNIIGLTCTAVYECLIVSVAKFFDTQKNKENNEREVKCEVLEKCIKNIEVFRLSEEKIDKLREYKDKWNSKDYKEYILSIKTRRNTKYAHIGKNKNETLKNYYIRNVLCLLRSMLNYISDIFELGIIIDERIIIKGLKCEGK